MGTERDPVPVTGLAANFSPIPRIAPPPLGSDIGGKPVSWLELLGDLSRKSKLASAGWNRLNGITLQEEVFR